MSKSCSALVLGIVTFLAMSQSASADAPVSTLQPGARVEYRFDYRGDGSAIRVVASETDINNLVISIYTSDQIAAVRRNENPTPVGRATRLRDDTLQWSGGFRGNAGVYYAVLENRASSAITYRLSISGDGVSGAARVAPVGPPITTQVVDQNGQKTLNVNLGSSITSTLPLTMPPEPTTCTPPAQISNPIRRSIKLCAGQIYAPLNLVGDNIALYADDARSAIIASHGRQFAVTLEGSNNWIEGVTIQARADPKDAGAWLCLYDECLFPTRPVTTTLRGGIQYGGGILLKGSNTTIHGVTVRGGTIGIATVNGRANKLVGNNLSDLNGWGSFNAGSRDSYFVGNTWSRDNHGCTTPDGRKFLSGCETSGWVCLGCTANVIARNFCELSSNCFYMSGERGLASNNNNFLENYCAGATENCFEITFSFGNVLRDNFATAEWKSGRACKYPFWIGGSVVFFANNVWECAISEDDAFNRSRDSTVVATNIIRLDYYLGALNAPRIVNPPDDDDTPPSQNRWDPEPVP